MHIKNSISEIHRTATGPATSLFLGKFYSDEEVSQALAEDSFTWLSGLKVLAARPFIVTPQKHSEEFRNYYWCPVYISIHIVPKFGQHLKQKYIYFQKNKKLRYLVNLKIKRDLIKIRIFRFNYIDLINFLENYRRCKKFYKSWVINYDTK
jgi:hypothetical protein